MGIQQASTTAYLRSSAFIIAYICCFFIPCIHCIPAY